LLNDPVRPVQLVLAGKALRLTLKERK